MSGKSYIDDTLSELDPRMAIIAAKVWAFCSDGDECKISRTYLCRVCGNCSKDTLQKCIQKLKMLGYIDYTAGVGAGCVSTFKKGENLAVLYEEKGRKNSPKKGENLAPYKYNNNIGRENAPACASTSPADQPTKKKKGYAGDAPATPKKGGNMDIQLFWDAFKASPEYDSEREATERLWFGLPEEWQACIVEGCRCGDRYRLEKKNGRYINGNPYWYLHDYKPEKERRWTRNQLYMRYGTDAVPGWSIIEQRDRDGYIQFMRTRAAKLAGVKIEREFV